MWGTRKHNNSIEDMEKFMASLHDCSNLSEVTKEIIYTYKNGNLSEPCIAFLTNNPLMLVMGISATLADNSNTDYRWNSGNLVYPEWFDLIPQTHEYHENTVIYFKNWQVN